MTSSFCYQRYYIKYWVFFLPESLTLVFSSWTASESLLLLVASQNQLVADNISRQEHSIHALVQDGSHIVAVDFDSVSGHIFWSDGTQGKIWSAFQNGTDRKLVSTGLLAFDLTSSPVLGLFAVVTHQWEKALPHLRWFLCFPLGHITPKGPRCS